MGGDQVYPTADRDAYGERPIAPFKQDRQGHGFTERDIKADLYAVPGNHDWYDGLSAFLGIICTGDPEWAHVEPENAEKRFRDFDYVSSLAARASRDHRLCAVLTAANRPTRHRSRSRSRRRSHSARLPAPACPVPGVAPARRCPTATAKDMPESVKYDR